MTSGYSLRLADFSGYEKSSCLIKFVTFCWISTIWIFFFEYFKLKGSFSMNHWPCTPYALSFYVTKTVLVGPKWFWSDQIDLDLTIMIWLWQNEMVTTKMNWSGPNVIHFGRKSQFGPEQFILVVTISFCHNQIIMVKSKSIWSDQNHFGPTKTVVVT